MVALVVTIVVLIILATISINAVFSDNGIIKKAKEAKEAKEKLTQMQESEMNSLLQEYNNMMAGEGNIGGGTTEPNVPEKPETPKGPNGKPLVNKDTVSETDHEKIIGEDALGNQVVIPNGFKVATDSGVDVEEGIVIEDNIGNQFVWVPVSNIDGDGVVENQSATGLITKKDGSKVQITLGRYTFARTYNNTTQIYEDGTPTIVQKGSEYAADNTNNKYTIGNYYTEHTIFRESNYKNDTTGTNSTAKSLQRFIESVRNNHGYYIARYEASFGSGDQPDASKIDTADYITNQKPLSKPSTSNTRENKIEELTEGMLWNYITQGDASKVSRNMYAENEYVESDLVNSYMWDTVIVYIQAMGNINYANADRKTTGNEGNLLNTGETGDEKCHIFDMASNIFEWTTEFSNSTQKPCTRRGDRCFTNSGNYVAKRSNGVAQSSSTGGCNIDIGFRPGLYIK